MNRVVTDAGGGKEWTGAEEERLPLSALNQYSYCPRRCALIHVEGVFVDNAFTLEGTLLHEQADTAGYETAAGVRVVRALPLFCRRLGLTGKADIVEFRGGIAYPVDYKRGKRKTWANDDVQLCAQAFCLEEMFGKPVAAGAVYHAGSKRRREVKFSDSLRAMTERVITEVRNLISTQEIPPGHMKPQCAGCSLHEICLPELSKSSADQAVANLFRMD
ncbi:MAG: CRISPR-associated protein Cas4 [Bryobacterales bacterium]|nr:CRISPR-associated protein Cas4 [Bryobacterales bacterium]